MEYRTYQAKPIIICLLYVVLSCAYQLHDIIPKLFYSVFPLGALYYAVLSVPKIHRIYYYTSVYQTVPKFTYMWRAYYHITLLPEAAAYTCLILCIILLYKDIRFLIFHAEMRLRAIDKELYESARNFRLAHLHHNTFGDDIILKKHKFFFHTNKIKFVKHTYESEETQNGIKNYEEYRSRHYTPPKRNTEGEERMWRASSYKYIFLENRDFFIWTPVFMLLTAIVGLYVHALSLEMYLNIILLTGDLITTILCTKIKNDLIIDCLYVLCAVFLLCTSVVHHY